MVAKSVVREAVKNQEFFGDNVVSFIEFSDDRIPMLKKKARKWYLFGLNGQNCDDLKRKLSAFGVVSKTKTEDLRPRKRRPRKRRLRK